ncbi:hypothetical protein SKAU_G00206420 [Synaphobranchus kaupii]|uniref:Uncharacterized protein n=1 Tax=Synaphobranchus kaupii TaxID=118154 RepID=A0A9Q1IYQ1_SYNKA|nr:hypothetical protein SKAU_G00206420 [Synaphobranchus kaupii]
MLTAEEEGKILCRTELSVPTEKRRREANKIVDRHGDRDIYTIRLESTLSPEHNKHLFVRTGHCSLAPGIGLRGRSLKFGNC